MIRTQELSWDQFTTLVLSRTAWAKGLITDDQLIIRFASVGISRKDTEEHIAHLRRIGYKRGKR